jgi:ubiquinone/menaquinone biosynthesis C-methylase UbiE
MYRQCGKLKELYIEHEERFGAVLAPLYSAFSNVKPMRKFYSFVIDDLRKSRFRSMLDVGTGPGMIPIALSKLKNARMYAVDPSESMIAIAKRKAGSSEKINFALGSSRHIPFKTKFDMIISTLSFHHWERKRESLQYLKKFLTEGGQIRIYELQRKRKPMLPWLGSHTLDANEAILVANSSGLRVTRIKKRDGFICLTMKP